MIEEVKSVHYSGRSTTDSLAEACGLPQSKRNRLPVLERINYSEPLELGNLIILAAVAAPLYRELGGINEWSRNVRIRNIKLSYDQQDLMAPTKGNNECLSLCTQEIFTPEPASTV